MTTERCPTTEKVAAMIAAAGDGGGGANIKSGSLSLPHNTWTAVIFNTEFSSVPNVVLTIENNSTNEVKMLKTRNISTTGFEIIDKMKTATSILVHWLATDAGNP